jgi:transposase
MPKILNVAAHLTDDELRARSEAAADADERMRWIAILQKKQGRSAELIADFCNRKPDWVRRTVRKYDEGGPDVVADKRVGNGHEPFLDAEGLKALEHALDHDTPPGGGLWNGPKVALWMSARLGHRVDPRTGWSYLAHRLKWSIKVPAQAHPGSDENAREAFKKGGSRPRSGRLFRAILTPL